MVACPHRGNRFKALFKLLSRQSLAVKPEIPCNSARFERIFRKVIVVVHLAQTEREFLRFDEVVAAVHRRPAVVCAVIFQVVAAINDYGQELVPAGGNAESQLSASLREFKSKPGIVVIRPG